jgi:hypothetical protein
MRMALKQNVCLIAAAAISKEMTGAGSKAGTLSVLNC